MCVAISNIVFYIENCIHYNYKLKYIIISHFLFKLCLTPCSIYQHRVANTQCNLCAIYLLIPKISYYSQEDCCTEFMLTLSSELLHILKSEFIVLETMQSL